MRSKKIAIIIVITGLLITPRARPARAADTVETWAVGATDLDFYTGYDGLGKRRLDRLIFGTIMLGYGLVERLSAYVGQNLQGNDYFAEGTGTTTLGIYGTPVDTKHFDLDLFLGFSLGGKGYREPGLTPMVELNFDLDPNRLSWGMYLRSGFRIHGRNRSLDQDNPDYETLHQLEVTVGTYYTIARRHQLLVEHDFVWRTKAAPGARTLEIGGLAFGYNATLSERFELITQVTVDLPQPGERPSVNFMTGFIVTLPSVTKAPPAPSPSR